MTIKDWLNRGRNLDEVINDLIIEKEKALDSACNISMSYDGDIIQKSSGNTSEDKFVKYADYSKLIDSMMGSLIKIKQEILHVIDKVDDCVYKDILLKRYILFYSWEKIADDMHYSRMQINRLHGYALQKIKMLHNVTLICDNM